MKTIKKAVIPAAGYGTRFLPITKVVPKELLPIGNKPAIHYVVEEAIASGVEEIILVCHPAKTEIIDYFRPDKDLKKYLEKKGKKSELIELDRIESMAKFKVVYQKEALGLGHAVWCARKELDEESFLVVLPDVLIADERPASLQLIESCQMNSDWGLLVERVTPHETSSYGIVRGEKIRDKTYSLEGAVEKPGPQEAPSNLGILGRYLLPFEIMDVLDGIKAGALGEIQLTDAINLLARRKMGRAVVVQGEIFDIGTPEGLKEANQHFEIASSRSSSGVLGRMKMVNRR